MPVNLSYNLFALQNQASTNDVDRPGSILLEAGTATVAISSNSGSVAVPTRLTTVLGIIPIAFEGSATPTAFFAKAGAPSGGSSTITVNATVANGNYTMRYFLVGKIE